MSEFIDGLPLNKTLPKYIDPESGFLTKHKDYFNKKSYWLSSDSKHLFEINKQKMGKSWIWYDCDPIEYNFDRYGFRNSIDPFDLEEDSYVLISGQSVGECTGVHYEDMFQRHVEKVTGLPTYTVATNGIDASYVTHNLINALKILPKPKYVINIPTSGKQGITTTYNEEKDFYINMSRFLGPLKDSLIKNNICSFDWITHALDEAELSNKLSLKQTAYVSECFKQQLMCDLLGIKNVITHNAYGDCKMEGNHFEFSKEVHKGFYENWKQCTQEIYFGIDNDVYFQQWPSEYTEFNKIIEISTFGVGDDYDLEFVNSRARDIAHIGPAGYKLFGEQTARRLIEIDND